MMWRARQYEQRSWLQLTTMTVAGLIGWLATDSSAISAKPSSANGYHRACTAGDIVGTWQVVKWRPLVKFSEKDRSSSYFHPHQLYKFAADGTLKSMTSTRPFDSGSSRAFERVPRVISYHFTSSGQLETRRMDSPGHGELWVCHFVTKDVKDAARQVDLRQGDVVMTLLGREGKPLFIRQLRRLSDLSGR